MLLFFWFLFFCEGCSENLEFVLLLLILFISGFICGDLIILVFLIFLDNNFIGCFDVENFLILLIGELIGVILLFFRVIDENCILFVLFILFLGFLIYVDFRSLKFFFFLLFCWFILICDVFSSVGKYLGGLIFRYINLLLFFVFELFEGLVINNDFLDNFIFFRKLVFFFILLI